MKKTVYLSMAVFFTVLLLSCKEDEEMNPTGSFTVTIQNISEGKAYFDAGMTDVILPGSNYSFSFHAGKGHYLSFATMFVQSNDLFYAPEDTGIELYNAAGEPLTGDVTGMVHLWDAGTEVNQEPGFGSDQAPRQSGPDTGMNENGNVILLVDVNDGFSYPSDQEILSLVIEHDGGTMFTVTINNVSDAGSFQTPLAPGTWVVHGEAQPLFSSGAVASGDLEDLAEDGINGPISDGLIQNSGFVTPFAPGVWAVYTMSNPIYSVGQSSSVDLESLAEDGDPSGFPGSLNGVSGVESFDIFTTPMGGASPAPIFPGEQYTFEFDAQPGDKLVFATMLVQSNDLFIGGVIDLFQNGPPVSGDITSQLHLYDAMTEVNEYPGAGINQAPRQSGPDTGTSENGMVNLVNDGFDYPAVTDMLRVSVTSRQN